MEKRKAGRSEVLSIVRKRMTRRMPKKALEARIATFLAAQNMCVLATCAGDVPRATPLEYHSDGTTLYMMVEAGRKIENILENPNVSVGIYGPYKGWLSVKGRPDHGGREGPDGRKRGRVRPGRCRLPLEEGMPGSWG